MEEEYWTVSTGVAVRHGWSCRECKQDIGKGSQMIVRDGRKLRFMYHVACYSGSADPRSQENSSYKSWSKVIAAEAPRYGK